MLTEMSSTIKEIKNDLTSELIDFPKEESRKQTDSMLISLMTKLFSPE